MFVATSGNGVLRLNVTTGQYSVVPFDMRYHCVLKASGIAITRSDGILIVTCASAACVYALRPRERGVSEELTLISHVNKSCPAILDWLPRDIFGIVARYAVETGLFSLISLSRSPCLYPRVVPATL